MEETQVSVPAVIGIIVAIVGGMSGIILGLVKWLGNRIHNSIDRLIDTTNDHTKIIAVEQERNDTQDDRLDRHEGEIDSLKERVWEVRYKRT